LRYEVLVCNFVDSLGFAILSDKVSVMSHTKFMSQTYQFHCNEIWLKLSKRSSLSFSLCYRYKYRRTELHQDNVTRGHNQELIFDYKSTLTVRGNRSFNDCSDINV